MKFLNFTMKRYKYIITHKRIRYVFFLRFQRIIQFIVITKKKKR